jgi:16S rRNA processing protein RimM
MYCFGAVQRTFGAQGELIVRLRAETEAIAIKEPVFVIIDELPVPFYFKSFELRGNHRAQVVFDDMESQKLAEELVGKTLWLPGTEKETTASQPDLTGYAVHDRQHGALGVVSGFLDITGNPCLQITYENRELIIPFNEAIVVQINVKKRLLETLLPEGLLEL